ncbi:aspartate aminotransferase [Ruminococcaceae bacterium D16]|nr:aspartate aminotransferase [Ruminococcaceae bacterium D16]
MATTLAERMSKFSGSPTSALIAKVAELKRQGKDIISLNVGEPDFGTPDYIKVAGMKAIADNFTKYTPGNGILELRQAIVKKLKEDNGLDYTVNEVTTAVGAKQAIASAMMVIAGPGDEVLLPIPCWVSYTEMIRLAGATPVFVPVRQDNYELDLDAIRAAITPRTKAIVICTPNNPTGAVYSEESLRELADLAVKHDFFIVADEIYEKMVYDGAKHFSVASISREVWERTITVNGFSKAYAMTGWRIGYAAARADVIKGIMAVQSQTTSATSAISQKAALAALQGSQHDMQVMVEEFKRRKDYVVQRLNAMEGITCPDVKGAFYVYPDVQPYLGKRFGDKVIENAVDLCQYLLDEALISTVPGEAYNVPGKIRISYSNSMENLEKALDRLEHALVQLK